MAISDPHIYCIGPLTLDLAQGRLLGAAGDVALRPKAFLLLATLARHAGHVVSKEALLSEVWPDVIVTEDSLTQCVHEVRLALGVDGASLLRTIPRRGYVLNSSGPAALTRPDRAGDADDPADVAPGSIAVMPFILPEGVGPRTRLLFDGLTHDVITHLARIRAYRVTGRGSTFALRQFAEDALRLRQLLRVAFVVSGRVCPPVAGPDGPFRLLVDVVRTEDGCLEWSDEVVLSTADLHSAAVPMADRLVSAISHAVSQAERRRALADRDKAPRAWEQFHIGLDSALRFSTEGMTQALLHFGAATALDPGFARAHAYASFCNYYFAFTGQLGDRKTGAAIALASATQALAADELCPPAHWAYGRALWLGGDPDAARHHVARAISLSPSFPRAHYMLGFIESQHGDPALGLKHLDHSESLSPFDPFLASIQITRAICHMRLDDMDAAALWAERATAHRTAYGHMLCNAGLILQAAGKEPQARAVIARLRGTQPDYNADGLFNTLYGMPDQIAKTLQRSRSRLEV